MVAALALSGCVVGPDFKTPPAPTQSGYEAGRTLQKTVSTSGPDGCAQVFDRTRQVRSDWYRLFGSPALDALIEQALTGNPTIAAGRARLAAAQEAVNAVAGGRYPHLEAGADVSRSRVTGRSIGLEEPLFVQSFTLYQTQLSADYELDLFGALARQIESQQALAEVQRDRLLETRLTLIDNVVASALTEAVARAALRATEKIAAAQRAILQLVEQQEAYGAAQRSDVLNPRQQLADIEATLPALQQQIAVARHRLAILTGQAPADYRGHRFTMNDFTLPARLPLSLPSQLVRQRPDVLAAAGVMHAELARVGVASARLLPDFRLTAAYGRVGLHPGDLADAPGAIWNIGAQLMAPLFEGGTLRAQKRAAQDQYRATAADYRKTALKAFAEVADALRALDNDARTLRSRQQALDAAQQALAVVEGRYQAGAADLLDVYAARQRQQRAAIRSTQARLARLTDTATLFRALGGGWWNASASAASAAVYPTTPKTSS
ncbi:MAG: efflux transporter outer membrane subunit [Gammaproteobacteria bacterium]|nr:efflux transporter outer membrane subunit [Gammaproteobacteria bacterium]